MMVLPDYCVTMARYNAWQNRQLRDLFTGLGEAALKTDRKAFFGSILKTASHLLWGDLIWLSRLDGSGDVPGGIAESTSLVTMLGDWEAQRFRTDGRILLWAESLGALDLQGELSWYSGVLGREVSKPVSLCITHFFNHQTHHRGQIHAMLTAAGSKAPVSDLAFMPEDGSWR